VAVYTATIDTALDPGDAWARVADVTRFAEWDPGTLRAVQVAGDGPGPDAVYVLTVRSLRGPLDLRYRVTTWSPPRQLGLIADTGVLRSDDLLTIDGVPGGSRLTYRAELTLHGRHRVWSPLLAVAFRVIGRQGAEGLRSWIQP
jgi:hypothetical protein